MGFNIKKISPRERAAESVSRELREVSKAIEAADADFNEVSDCDLIEAAIFERSALRARYGYLLKELRRLEGE